MEASNRIMMIGKTPVEVTDTELNQADLLFYSENPRVFTALQSTGEAIPSQASIQRIMCKLDSVKKLKTSIEANDGLLNPIIVRGNVVLEGNSRLAAYRLLAAIDPIKWSKIKCTLLPEDISDELVFNLLGTIHIIGQTPWSAFEQAGYLYRTKQKSRRPIKAIAKDLGMKQPEAELYVRVYQKMMDAEDTLPTRWSYYYELLKSKHIAKADENNPSLNLIDTIVEKIKNNEFERAEDIRKVAEVAKAQTEEGLEVMMDYLEDVIDLEDAVEQVSDENQSQIIAKGFERFQKLLQEYDANIRQQVKTDSDFNLLLKQIEDSLHSYLRIR